MGEYGLVPARWVSPRPHLPMKLPLISQRSFITEPYRRSERGNSSLHPSVFPHEAKGGSNPPGPIELTLGPTECLNPLEKRGVCQPLEGGQGQRAIPLHSTALGIGILIAGIVSSPSQESPFTDLELLLMGHQVGLFALFCGQALSQFVLPLYQAKPVPDTTNSLLGRTATNALLSYR